MHTTRVKAQKNRAAITIAVYTHMNRCREQGAEVLRQLEADEQLLTECSRLLSKEQGKCQPFWLDNQKNRPAEQESCCLEVIRCPRAVPSTHCLSHHSQMSFLILNKQPHSTSFLRILMPLAGVQMAQDSVNFFHLKHHARTKALLFHHLTMLSQYSHPPPKASNESISLLPEEEDKAQNRQDSFSVSATINAGCRRMERTLASCTMVFITHLNKCTLINTMQCRGRTFLTVFKERPSTQKKQVLWGLLQMFPPSVTALARINS